MNISKYIIGGNLTFALILNQDELDLLAATCSCYERVTGCLIEEAKGNGLVLAEYQHKRFQAAASVIGKQLFDQREFFKELHDKGQKSDAEPATNGE